MSPTHETVDECLNDEDYRPGTETETVIDEQTDAETHTQTVECPTCSREYEYVFDFTGVYDPEQGDYIPAPDRFEEVNDAAYYDGQLYKLPIITEGSRRLELVYHLGSLVYDGEVRHQF